MKYYEQLAILQTFKKSDLDLITKNSNLSNQILKNYLKKGLIKKISYNYYGTVDLSSGILYANKYLIGSKISNETFISHRSALEFYGFYNQVYNELYVSNSTPFKSFTFDYITYTFLATNNLDVGVNKIRGIRVSTIERSIVDSIKDIDKVSDIEEIIKSISLIPIIDVNKLVDYLLVINNKTLFKKVGYILEYFKDQLHINQKILDFLKEKGDNVRGYFSQIDKNIQSYNKDWKFYTFDYKYFNDILSKGVDDYNVWIYKAGTR